MIYGGATSAYRVDAGDETIYLDAGSGIYADRPGEGKRVSILLSHWHLDHLAGLGMFLQKNKPAADIYGPAESDEEARRLLRALYSPPFWPVEMEALGARIHALPKEFRIGKVTVRTAEGFHPNGCRIIRLEYMDRSLVYATDFEASEDAEERLIGLSEGADLLLYDGQFREDEAEKLRGSGHSTPDKGLEIKRKSGAGRLVIVHHGADRSDEDLLAMERALREKDGNCWFARQGEELFSLNT
jgi:ribonuclease BN (tRNA processing enzyme)